MQKCTTEAVPLCLGVGWGDREDDGHPFSHTSGPSVVQRIATLEEPRCERLPVIRSPGKVVLGSPVGVGMVVYPGEREEYTVTSTRVDCGDRRIQAGLGSCLQGGANRRPMVTVREGKSYQLHGTVGGNVGSEDVHQGLGKTYISSFEWTTRQPCVT